jgi:hypothetical protein
MCAGTNFNSEFFGTESLVIEDEQPSTDIRSRRAFGVRIKDLCVNRKQRLHGKHREALILCPFWRVSISLNDEPEDIQVLPPIDDSIADKLMILRASKKALPMPTNTTALRDKFWAALMAQIPAMLVDLVTMEIPAELRCERYGVKHFHHPHILEMLSDLAPETRLLAIIDGSLFPSIDATSLVKTSPPEMWQGTADELQSALTLEHAAYSYEARRILTWPQACGCYLGRLAKSRPDRVTSKRTADSRRWCIRRTASTDQ